MSELETLEKEYEELAEKLEYYRRQYLLWNKMLDYDLDIACNQIAYYDKLSRMTKQNLLETRGKIVEVRKSHKKKNRVLSFFDVFFHKH